MTRKDIWFGAWAAVAGSFNGKLLDCERFADACLAQFDERFPTPKPIESSWRGTPISELSDDEVSEWRTWVLNGGTNA